MAQINFDAAQYDPAGMPATLPTAQDDPFPPNCGLSADQKSLLGTTSAYPGLGLLDTPDKVIRHWELLNAERAQRKAIEDADRAKAERYDPVKSAARMERKQAHERAVFEANQAWRTAVAERTRVVTECDAKVAAARAEYQRIKAQGY
jgi:uncharacterized membrane protein YqiK